MRELVPAGLFLLAMPAIAKSELTDLSQSAAALQMGMSQCEVVSLLGEPDWIILQGEDEETADVPSREMVWKNDDCSPVRINIGNADLQVTGWDEGRALCGMDADSVRLFWPKDEYLVSETRNSGCSAR